MDSQRRSPKFQKKPSIKVDRGGPHRGDAPGPAPRPMFRVAIAHSPPQPSSPQERPVQSGVHSTRQGGLSWFRLAYRRLTRCVQRLVVSSQESAVARSLSSQGNTGVEHSPELSITLMPLQKTPSSQASDATPCATPDRATRHRALRERVKSLAIGEIWWREGNGEGRGESERETERGKWGGTKSRRSPVSSFFFPCSLSFEDLCKVFRAQLIN
jgi:hypothetical protein